MAEQCGKTCVVTDIGETAGRIWESLVKSGEKPRKEILREVGGSREMFERGLGWLAREGKLEFKSPKGVETICVK